MVRGVPLSLSDCTIAASCPGMAIIWLHIVIVSGIARFSSNLLGSLGSMHF